MLAAKCGRVIPASKPNGPKESPSGQSLTLGRGTCPLPLVIWLRNIALASCHESYQIPPWHIMIAGSCSILCVNSCMIMKPGRGICLLPPVAWREEYVLCVMPRAPSEQFKECGSQARAPLPTPVQGKPMAMLVPLRRRGFARSRHQLLPCTVRPGGR